MESLFAANSAFARFLSNSLYFKSSIVGFEKIKDGFFSKFKYVRRHPPNKNNNSPFN